MDILEELNFRGMINDFSDYDKIKEILKKPTTLYCGFDPSADSLHLGNFVMITTLRRLQKAGHRVIAVVGGGTGMIGDPSGKKSERSFLNEETIKYNVKCIENQLRKYLDFSDPSKGIIVNNYDWLSKISIIEYLRDYGKFFSINYMLAKDIIASRLEAGISYTEFSYMILQSLDFVRLNKEYGCQIQIGGGDQWGNLTAGLELFRKIYGDEKDVQAMSIKLLLNSEGKKFGKSEKGALYLDENKTSAYQIYQYFINCSDEDSIKYMKVFTDFSKEEIEEINKTHSEKPELRYAQKVLAKAIITILHGEEVASDCEAIALSLFTDQYALLNEKSLLSLAESLDNIHLAQPTDLVDCLVNTKLASSKREAREFIKNGSIKVNGEKIIGEFKISKDIALHNKVCIIKRGKKNFGAIIF